MSDPSPSTSTTDGRSTEVTDQLTRSLNSIWQRHAGGKPSAVSMAIKGDVVTFVMQDAVSGIGSEVSEDDADSPARSPDSPEYKIEAIAAVRKITRRNVRGFIPKRNKKTDVASDTYILEPVHQAR